MFQKKEMLKNLMEPNESNELSPMIIKMCHGNLKMTKKVCSALLKAFATMNYGQAEKQTYYMGALRQFMKIDDDLKRQRIDWIFGVPEI